MTNLQFTCYEKSAKCCNLCGKNNLHLDAPKDIGDSIIESGLTFKKPYTNVNIFICEFYPVIITGR